MEIKEALPIGTILDSGKRKYAIKSVLGQGGFGITYIATSTIYVDNIPFETQFAIKEHYISSMNERQGTSVSVSNANNTEEIKESIDSFLVEAQRLNKLSLNHSGIVRVNESFRSNGTAYYVMEYIKGQSLREYVRSSPLGRLLEAEALQLFRPVAETIGYLHDNKVTHLDIKPDNILIRDNGEPVVIDFGLSKHYSSKGTPTSTIKAAGCSAGYSPMEQYVGITTFTPEADIYALAATLLYMLTGKDPMVSTEITENIIANSLINKARPSTISSIKHGMAKLKENRVHSIIELHTELFFNLEEEGNLEPNNITNKYRIKLDNMSSEFINCMISNKTLILGAKSNHVEYPIVHSFLGKVKMAWSQRSTITNAIFVITFLFSVLFAIWGIGWRFEEIEMRNHQLELGWRVTTTETEVYFFLSCIMIMPTFSLIALSIGKKWGFGNLIINACALLITFFMDDGMLGFFILPPYLILMGILYISFRKKADNKPSYWEFMNTQLLDIHSFAIILCYILTCVFLFYGSEYLYLEK